MDREAASGIKFFHLSSRLNRLRYFSYGIAMSWISMPIFIASIFFMLRHALLMGVMINLAAELFFIPIQFTFMIRRLHDLDRNGWWSLIYAAVVPLFFFAGLGMRPPGFVAILLLLGLMNFGFFLMLLFASGTQGENRFGAPPSPNSTWVVIGAWSALPLLIFTILLEVLAVASLQNRPLVSRGGYAATIARRSIEQARLYRQDHHEWPTDFGSVAGGDLAQGLLYKVSTIKYPDGSYGIIVTDSASMADRAMEVWTTDGGESWHCGPSYTDPIPKESLPADCQDEPPTIP